jgi:hypothetical protein
LVPGKKVYHVLHVFESKYRPLYPYPKDIEIKKIEKLLIKFIKEMKKKSSGNEIMITTREQLYKNGKGRAIS